MLNQSYFKITEYADRLLADAEQLEGCCDRVLLMQRNWIGRSRATNMCASAVEGRDEPVTVFAARPNTLYRRRSSVGRLAGWPTTVSAGSPA